MCLFGSCREVSTAGPFSPPGLCNFSRATELDTVGAEREADARAHVRDTLTLLDWDHVSDLCVLTRWQHQKVASSETPPECSSGSFLSGLEHGAAQ